MNLRYLIESDIEKAEVVLAAKSILDKFQKIAEDLARVEANEIMPILDSLKLSFGPEMAARFNDNATKNVRLVIEAIKSAKDAISTDIASMESGEIVNDMAADEPADSEAVSDVPSEDAVDDIESLLGDDSEGAGGDDLEIGGDIAPEDQAIGSDAGAAGRARKESVSHTGKMIIERNIAKLRESKNPDVFICQAFSHLLKEGFTPRDATIRVSESFAIDASDVYEAIKEVKKAKNASK